VNKGFQLRVAAVAVTAVALVGAGGAAAYATTSTPRATQTVVTGADHQRLTFTLAPGASKTFTIPKANDPVRVDIAEVSTNGGIQTWIGTNSDASQTAGTTISGTDITNLTCGSSCTIASLKAGSISGHTVTLTTNGATSIIKETYVVNIWY